MTKLRCNSITPVAQLLGIILYAVQEAAKTLDRNNAK